jgi:hypothetical protein
MQRGDHLIDGSGWREVQNERVTRLAGWRQLHPGTRPPNDVNALDFDRGIVLNPFDGHDDDGKLVELGEEELRPRGVGHRCAAN